MRNPSIMIIEDEPVIAADLEDRLSQIGYHIQANVESGEEAIRLVRKQVPDLILMDIHLSGKMDGIEAAMIIRRTTNVPLIFLTSNSDTATFRRARQARPQAFLSKPFRGRDLEHAIELALGGDPAEDSRHDNSDAGGNSPNQATQDRLFIKEKGRLLRLLFEDILYLEADDYYCKVYTTDKSYLATKTLKKLSAQLPGGSPFFRCHRSYVVNLSKVTEIGEQYVFLGQRKVPLSRSKRSEILALVNRT